MASWGSLPGHSGATVPELRRVPRAAAQIEAILIADGLCDRWSSSVGLVSADERLERPPTPAGFDASRAAERAADPTGWRFGEAARDAVYRVIGERRDIRRFRPDTNQRFPIFFPEKRPFFLEGIDIFRTMISAVHTRAIVDPDLAVKLSGKRGPDTFGLMLATDNGPGNLNADDRGSLINCQRSRLLSPAEVCRNENIVDRNAYVGVLRLKHDLGKSENTIGILATTYNFIQKHNDLAGFDGRFKLNKKTNFDFQLLGTTSRNFFYNPDVNKNEYRTGKGLGYSLVYNVSGRNFGMELYGEGFTKDYRADVGFFGRTNTNFNSVFTRYDTDRNPKKKIINRHVHNFSWIGYDFQGRIQNWESEFYVEWRLPRNSYFSLAYEPAYERILEEEFGPRRNGDAARSLLRTGQ